MDYATEGGLMRTQYPDYIYFKRATGLIKGFCKIINIHDGLVTIELKKDGKEHIIPNRSIIELIKDARGDNESD